MCAEMLWAEDGPGTGGADLGVRGEGWGSESQSSSPGL